VLGEDASFLGFEICRNFETHQIWLGQPFYAQKLIEKFGYKGMSPVTTLWKTKMQIPLEWDPVSGAIKEYQQHTRFINYLATGTCPNIVWVNNKLCEGNSGSLKHYLKAQKHILRYLKGITNLGIIFGSYYDLRNMGLYAILNAAYGDVLEIRYSTNGHVIYLANALIF
jgi:hypothetical protein